MCCLFDGIFLVCVTRFKDWRVIPMDVCNALVFGAISCIVSTFVMSMMYGNFITSSKLTTVAESDLNTRLHNRNAYENRLRDYPLRCSNSLTCVYIDVNGLHELNNTYGHEAGRQDAPHRGRHPAGDLWGRGQLPHWRR